jgi:crotonobetainyl-CoA:carnitine CoA-transferase CaiB-like acyl-CoA transferase
MALVAGILMALYRRERTGEGTTVATSLLANGLWSNGVYAQAALVGAFLPLRPPRRGALRHHPAAAHQCRGADGDPR